MNYGIILVLWNQLVNEEKENVEQINEWLEQINELCLLGLSQNSGPSNFCPWYICWKPPEAPVRNGVLERVDNVKRGRGRPKLTWDESVKRDLKD